MAWHQLTGTLLQNSCSQEGADEPGHLWRYPAASHQRSISSGPGPLEAEDRQGRSWWALPAELPEVRVSPLPPTPHHSGRHSLSSSYRAWNHFYEEKLASSKGNQTIPEKSQVLIWKC